MSTQLHSVLVAGAVSVIGLLVTAVLSPTQSTQVFETFSKNVPFLRVCMVLSFSISAGVAGVVVGRIGPQVVSLVGGAIITVGMLTTVFVPSYYYIPITYGVITGIGCGLVYVCLYEAVRMTYTTHRNYVYGVLGCVSYTGFFLGPRGVQCLLTCYTWRGALLIMMGVVMNIIPFSLLLPGGRWKRHFTYSSLQDAPVSASRPPRPSRKGDVRNGLNGFNAEQNQDSEDTATLWETTFVTNASYVLTIIKILRKTGFHALLFAGCLYAYGASVVLGHLEVYTAERQAPDMLPTGTLFIISGVTLCVMKLLQGVLMDCVDPLYWYMGCACVGGVLTFVFMIPLPMIVIYLYTGLLGVSLAGTGSEIISPIIIHLAKTDTFAFPFGIYVCLTSLATLIGNPLTTEWVFEKSNSHKPVFVMAAITMTLTAIICFLLRRKLKTRQERRERIYRRRVVSQDDSYAELVTSV